METELYTAVQSLITLIERTDFTRRVSVTLDMGNSMIAFVLIVAALAVGLGFTLGSAYQERKDEDQLKTYELKEKYADIVERKENDA